MKQDKKYYDNFFKNHPVNVHDDSERFVVVASLLSGRVLDVGCGTGTLSDYFSGDYYGFDFSDEAIRLARSVRRSDAVFFVQDVDADLQSYTAKFDSAYIGEVLEHIEDDRALLDNLILAMNPGGRIIVTVPNCDRVPDESHCRSFSVSSIRRDYSRYGRIEFFNWSGFVDRILFVIHIDQEPRNDVSLVMIVKDEEKGLETAILSAINFTDRIVISVDSLSSDRTRDIAEKYADELKTHVWNDNFSEARNFAQSNVKTKWILFLDGHEYIDHIGKIRPLLAEDIDGILVTIRLENGMTFLFPRIYRTGIQFTGAVHNLNECKRKKVFSKFLIVHDRENLQSKDSSQRRTEQRNRMLPKIMKKRLAKDKRDLRALFHLGNYYMMIREFEQAAHFYREYIKYGKNSDELYLMTLNYGICLQLQGKLIRALWSFDRCEKIQPGRFETARMLGGVLFAMRRFNDALIHLTRALAGNSRQYLYCPFPPDFLVIWDLIGSCYNILGRSSECVVAWEQALTFAKDEKIKKFFETKIHFVKMLK